MERGVRLIASWHLHEFELQLSRATEIKQAAVTDIQYELHSLVEL